MKKCHQAWLLLQDDIKAAVTPELKRQACDDAIAGAKDLLSGIAQTFVILIFTELRGTIQG